jgi:hypothetical protein
MKINYKRVLGAVLFLAPFVAIASALAARYGIAPVFGYLSLWLAIMGCLVGGFCLLEDNL